MIEIGQEVPDFCLPDYQGEEYCLHNFRGKWVVLYFYPKDNTAGCTQEAKDFTEMRREFENLNAVIIGASKDSPKSHEKFVHKHQLGILLLSDEEHKVIEGYGAWGKKKNYGREYFGTVRSTFIIDPEGKMAHIWKKVRVKGHVQDVLNKLKELEVKK